MSKSKADLDSRMKHYYEEVPKIKLARRIPVAIRLDGKAFHTFTRGFDRPFDKVFRNAMMKTTLELCKNIQGCVLGYTQSDEITLILIDYQTLTTDAWFDYEVQKMCSVSASMATLYFNRAFNEEVRLESKEVEADFKNDKLKKLYSTHCVALRKGATFDSRCFNIPKEEVANLILWRQNDASKNSISMVAQTYFSQKELNKKKSNDMQDMLMTQKGINWNNFSIPEKRGVCCIRVEEGIRTKWTIDKEIPIFKGEDREYINNLVYVGE